MTNKYGRKYIPILTVFSSPELFPLSSSLWTMVFKTPTTAARDALSMYRGYVRISSLKTSMVLGRSSPCVQFVSGCRLCIGLVSHTCTGRKWHKPFLEKPGAYFGLSTRYLQLGVFQEIVPFFVQALPVKPGVFVVTALDSLGPRLDFGLAHLL